MDAEPESGGSWTRGLNLARALALEAVRYSVAIWLVLTLVFLAFQVWAGNPALSLIPRDPKYAGFGQQNIDTFALGQPVWTRYGVWLLDAFTGNLGLSYYYRLPVSELVTTWLPATLELIFATTLWIAALGGLLGWAAASRRFRVLRVVSRGIGLLAYAFPLFWILLLVTLGVSNSWHVLLGAPMSSPTAPPRVTGFPVLDALLSGNVDDFWLALWTTALLTLIPGGLLCLPVLLRVRNRLREVRDSPGFAGLPTRKGLPPGTAFRASLAPMAGGVAVLMPFIVSAALVTEWIGGRRGLGFFVIQGVDTLDMPLVQGALTVAALAALLAALPFALLGAAFLRESSAASLQAPGTVPDPVAFGRWLRAVLLRAAQPSSWAFWMGVVLVAVPIVLSAAAPLLSPYSPLQRVTDTSCSSLSPAMPYLQPPCPAHPLGTDYFGFDIFSKVLAGGTLFMVATLEALAVAAGIAFALGLLCGLAGRFADVPLRIALGAVAAIPCLVLLFLIFIGGSDQATASALVPALVVVFVPVLFRDAAELVRPVARPRPLAGAAGRSGLARLVTSLAAIGPGFVARLPRRLAEMGLLFETFAFLGVLPSNAVDWSRITLDAVVSNAFVLGNWLWLVVPGLLLFVYAAGLLLMSDGLRRILTPEEPRQPAPEPVLPPTPEMTAPATTNP